MTIPMKRECELLRLVGINPARLTKTEIKDGAELLRRISACDRIPGAGARRSPAAEAWRAFSAKIKQ